MQTDQIDFQQVIAVTNRHLCVRSFAEQIDRVCRMHPRAIVLRESDLPPEDYACMVSETLFFCLSEPGNGTIAVSHFLSTFSFLQTISVAISAINL